VDIFNDGGIEALHKHTALSFTCEHVLLMSIDSAKVGRRSLQKTLDGKGFQKKYHRTIASYLASRDYTIEKAVKQAVADGKLKREGKRVQKPI
jgi:hypothetical protein